MQRKSPSKKNSSELDLNILSYLKSTTSKASEIVPQTSRTYNLQSLKIDLNRIKQLIAQNTQTRSSILADATNQDLIHSHASADKISDSDYQLFQGIKDCSDLSLSLDECQDYVQCYRYIASDWTFKQLLSLISNHPNIYVAAQVLAQLRDLVESDISQSSSSDKLAVKRSQLTQCFVSCNLPQLLSNFLQRKDRENDDSVITCLTVLVDLCNYPDSLYEILVACDKLNDQVYQMCKVSSASQVTLVNQYAMEYLNVLLTDSRNTKGFPSHDLVDQLLVSLSKFLKVQLSSITPEGREYVENTILLLSFLVSTSDQCNSQFIADEGIELMLMMVSSEDSRWHTKTGFKILDSACTKTEIASILVEKGILKPVFQSINYRKLPQKSTSLNIYLLDIIGRLFKYLPFDSDDRLRLLNKFMNKNYKNFNKLMKYKKIVDTADDLDETLMVACSALINTIIAWISIDDIVPVEKVMNIFTDSGLTISSNLIEPLHDTYQILLGETGTENDDTEVLKDLYQALSSRY
ncbi:hypothetical protein FOA43_002075 [Brettanomyces nanus]|uniref:Beta-catenin-like protein 1 N-terminal domain-containing protein n=1 Tax=Eeniella nana TaxID=13502 RepID=A0A875S3V2_EENNA|nr:uncharacterized protein FOA43_002075 [Brettanomyces nanus]QPG74742.1 hypothetical protein FOA43_002075 [Brettanomyces nanus]